MQENIGRDETRSVTLSISMVHKASYTEVVKENIVISAWKYGKWGINNFLGEVTVPLQRVISESVARSDVIKMKQDGRNKSSLGANSDSLRVTYRCYFQEIWNYKLRFSDFKIANLQHNDGKAYSPGVEFTIEKVGSIKTETFKSDKNPLWETVSGDIKFKGALYELEDKDLKITILDRSGIRKTPISTNKLTMKGIATKGSIRCPVKLNLNQNSAVKKDVLGTNINDGKVDWE